MHAICIVSLTFLGLTYSSKPLTTLVELADAIKGTILIDESVDYEVIRQQYDQSLSKSPLAIIRCTKIKDVQLSLQYALDNDLEFVVRSGGHSTGGFSTCDGCIMIDLAELRDIRIRENRAQPIVQVEAGNRVNDLMFALENDAESGKKYWLPAGAENVGLGGHIHGGGWGVGVRKYGMTTDNLVEARVVIIDDEQKVKLVKASLTKAPELFYCIRGTIGPMCGIVVEYTLKIYEQNCGGYTWSQIQSIGTSASYYAALDGITVVNVSQSDERDLSFGTVHSKLPQLPFITSSCTYVFYDGDAVAKEAAYSQNLLAEIQEIGGIVAGYNTYSGSYMYIRCISILSLTQRNLTQCLDQEFLRTFGSIPSGIQSGGWLYDSSDEYFNFVNSVGYAGMINNIANNCPSTATFCAYYMSTWGGKMNEPASNATAFPYRDTKFDFVVFQYFPVLFPQIIDAAYANAVQWIDDTFINGLYAPGFTTNRAYCNYVVPSITAESDYLPYYYGDNIDQIIDAKCLWDPNNYFSTPQGIPVDSCSV